MPANSEGPPLHPALEPLEFLMGTWKGKGAGMYPDIDDFDFLEVASYSHVGKPFITYAQRTSDAVTGQPLHAETGYIRPVGGDRAEMIVAHPTGVVEIHDVEIKGSSLLITSSSVVSTPSAKRVDGVIRQLSVARNDMHYAVQMAAMGHGMRPHLEAVLSRD